MARPRVYEIAAGYEDWNNADFLRSGPAFRPAIGMGEDYRSTKTAG